MAGITAIAMLSSAVQPILQAPIDPGARQARVGGVFFDGDTQWDVCVSAPAPKRQAPWVRSTLW